MALATSVLRTIGCTLCLGICAGGTSAADMAVWVRDIDAARTEAKAGNKDLFLLFTGVGWCKPCMDFDRKVLKQPPFLDSVRKSYTLVELDHTFGDTPAEKARQARFAVWEKQYLINAFPTLVLADAAGRPYAVMTGCETEVPVMLEWIAKARAARDERDHEMKAAAGATGADRAKALHKAIQAVAGKFGTLDERGDDPVLCYYQDQVAEIARLDVGGEIRKVYDDRRSERDRWAKYNEVFHRLGKFGEAKDYRGAVDFINEALKTTTDPMTRFRLERSRIAFLESDAKHEDALRNIREMRGRDKLTADDRYWLMREEAVNLMSLGRVEEGIAVYDRCIADADTPEKRVNRLLRKAGMIPSKTHRELKMAAFRALRAEAPHGGDQWQTATYFLADDAREAGRPTAALALFREEMEFDTSPWAMTQVAECYLDLKEPDKVKEWLERAEAENARQKASHRQGDQEKAVRAEKRIMELRDR